ncbi:MAG: FAD:protein FMN transferase, partial [Planctomycetota bacterium]
MAQPSLKRQLAGTLIGLIVIVAAFLATRSLRTVTVDSGMKMTMGTFARILAVARTEKQADIAMAAAFEKIYEIDEIMSDYDPDSELSRVNRDAFDGPVKVSDELFEVLTAAVEYSKLSDGAFDVTIGPVIQLWRKAKDQGAAPTKAQIELARQSVGYQHLILDETNQTVRFTKPGMFLDLGGIAKGYAIDQAVAILKDAGLPGGMVDIGGDLRCFGAPAEHKTHWFIGLQDPDAADGQAGTLLTLIMDDRAVATSGDYCRYVVIDGQKHSHIISPQTADP